MLGKTLMPWQQHVLDVALEVDPDSGLPVYREVVLTVPRQSGKTTSVLCLMIHRALGFSRAQRITYTAQTRLAAREKWEYEHLPTLAGSPLAGMYRTVLQRGEERIVFTNGSIYGIESTQETAGHGNTLDLGIIDEAFSRVDAAGEQAMRPAMITRPDAQLWVLSTAGKSKAKSPYLWGKVKAGRARVESGVRSGIAYFEWSAAPEADIRDPATWRGCMPALGHTVTEAAIRGELESMAENPAVGLPEFRRAYGNQWADDVAAGWDVIPRPAWTDRSGAEGRPASPVAFGIAASWPDAEWAAIGSAGRLGTERLVQVVDHRPGVRWVVERAVELNGHRPCAFVVDPSGPAGQAVTDLEAAGLDVLKVTAREACHAAGQLVTGVLGEPAEGDRPGQPADIRHYGQPELDASVADAGKRHIGDVWRWDRRATSAPIEAVTLAGYGLAVHGSRVAEPLVTWR
jgi:hypothetical protein